MTLGDIALSVVIPTLNEAEHLPSLLEDLKKQQQISLQIIIGDGGSNDATRKVAESFGVLFVSARRGRGAQMNAAVSLATSDFILFLHADSRIADPLLLSRALETLLTYPGVTGRTAGHFQLRFMRSDNRNGVAYRYAEEKTAFNRPNTTNGDQGLLISQEFFRELGGFDERLPFLEDQRIAGKIRAAGEWLTLPGYLKTSARRFEAEGFHRRYILMSMMMGLYSIGANDFFTGAPGVYRTQQDTGRLLLSPFFKFIRQLMHDNWGFAGTVKNFYLLGRYINQNSWQLFFFVDVLMRPLLGTGRYPFLKFHDRFCLPCISFKIFDVMVGILCFVWFLGVLAPFFWFMDGRKPSRQELSPGKAGGI